MASTLRSADSLDWKGISAEEISKRVVDRVKPGSIILFHNAAEHTPEALPGILETLLSQGYKIVPISALVMKGKYNVDYTIDHTGRQIAKTAAPDAAKSGEKTTAPDAAKSGEKTTAPDAAKSGEKTTAPDASKSGEKTTAPKASKSKGKTDGKITPEKPSLKSESNQKKK